MKSIKHVWSSLVILVLLTACASQPSTPSASSSSATTSQATSTMANQTITIQALDANKQVTDITVPLNPQRIAVLDMAALDTLDSLDLGDRIVGSAQVSIDYLKGYNPDDTKGAIANLGTVKTVDLEAVAAADPDIIFIGGRLSASYADLEAIAPVVYLAVDYDKGVVQSTQDNASTIASIFGLEDQVAGLMEDYQSRIDALKQDLEGKQVLLSMYNNKALNLLSSQSQLNLITNELGAINLADQTGQEAQASHGQEASWETILEMNPEYLFVLDRTAATGNESNAKEVIENDLIKDLAAYKEGKIVYFIDHANVWYTATGGIQALDTMLSDLETALNK